jgi:uncharacterized protein YabE (DUF348 family)
MRNEPKTEPSLYRLPRVESTRVPTGFFTLLLTIALVAIMAVSYAQSGEAMDLEVNGRVWRVQTHQRTVGAFLREVGLDLRPEDIVLPPLGTLLTEQQTIAVQKALPVLVEADGQVVEHCSHSRQVMDLLREMGLNPKPYDVVLVDGKPVDLDAPLPHYQWTPNRWPLLQGLARRLGNPSASPWLRLTLRRAVPLSINDDGTQVMIYSVAPTVGEALLSQGIALYLGDRVRPLLGTLLTAGMHVEIHRATPVTIQVDGRAVRTRTQAYSVAQLLSEAGIALLGKDYTIPGLDTEVIPDTTVRVVRVIEAWVLESEDIAFETIWRSDSGLELDQRRSDQAGRLGVRKRRVRIVYEDGEEKTRMVADEWIERQPTTRIVSYGTQVVVRELETPDGVIRYWRRIRMLATSYSAATSGKPPDHPQYGITRLGWQAQKGVVAVDPRVISLLTKVYVPGYGFGTAADTGGRILGRWIDLCYDEGNLVLWKRWVDVYLLEPIPPADEINWTLPDYPSERR